MQLPLSASFTKNGNFEYKIAPAYRLIFSAVSLILFAAANFDGTHSIPGNAAALISLAGLFYTETWIFAPEKIIFKNGFFMFLKINEWQTAAFSSVSVSPFIKGEMNQSKAYEIFEKSENRITMPGLLYFSNEGRIRLRLILKNTDGTVLTVDESGIRAKEKFFFTANMIAEKCSITLLNKKS
jgi:hypothetical protein